MSGVGVQGPFDSGTSAGRMVAHSETTVTLVNSTDETDLWSYTIPAGSLVAGDRLRCFFAWDALNNTGGNVSFTPKVYVGATAVLTGSAASLGTGANRRKGVGEFVLTCVDGTNQKVSGGASLGPQSSATMPNSTSGNTNWYGVNTATEDTSAAKVFKLTMTLDTASANADVRLSSFYVVKIPVGS